MVVHSFALVLMSGVWGLADEEVGDVDFGVREEEWWEVVVCFGKEGGGGGVEVGHG